MSAGFPTDTKIENIFQYILVNYMQIIWTPLLHIMVFIRRCSYTILYHIFHTSAGSPVVSPWDTSGAKTPPHALFPPHPSHHEQNRPPTHFSLLICYIRKTATCPTLHSTPHSHFPHLSHQEQNRPHAHFSLLICNIGSRNTLPHTYPSSSITSGNGCARSGSALIHLKKKYDL